MCAMCARIRRAALRRRTGAGDAPADITEPGNLRVGVMRGVAWKAATQVVLQAARAISTVLIARLLLPEEFGLAMMAIVVSSIALIFSDLALGAALIQRKELSQDDCSTVFWLSVGVGVVMTLIGIALADPVAGFFGEPRVEPLFAVMSLTFVLSSLGITHVTLLTRAMDFRSLELRLMVGGIAGAAVGVTLAVLDFGAWAIIAQHLTAAALGSALAWRGLSWRPSRRFSMASLRSIAAFSANVFGSRLLFYVSRNADSLLIGRFLGPAALGAYSIAYNIMLLPFSRIAGPLQEALFPAFARLQDDPERMGNIWVRANRVVAAISLPAMLGLTVVAPDFVRVVLGDKWEAAIPVIQVLAWVGFLQSLSRLNTSIQQARDRTDLMLRWSVLITVSNLVAFAIGLEWGIVGVAVGYAISNTLLQPLNAWQTGRLIGVPLRRLAGAMAGVVQATVLMLAVIVPLQLVLVEQGVPSGLRLLAVTLGGGAVYLGACLWRAADVVEEVKLVRRRRSGADPAAPPG